MLNSKPTQFSLIDDGQILWQEDASNPMPGVAVAKAVKGDALLKPSVELVESEARAGLDDAQVLAAITDWLNGHIAATLESLVALETHEGEGPVASLASKVFDGGGVIARADVEHITSQLDTDTRRDVRGLKIRLGPILIFMPELNKPAGVRLKALLWTLYNDKPLPAAVPKDGVVSYKLEEGADADEGYYRFIGYPLYAGRACRIDMLDRVIVAVYDSAEKGKFQAKHEMAEWLGCPIEDLYQILSAMGHKKVHDPAEIAEEAVKLEELKAAAEGVEVEKPEAPKEPVKPELATFALKKGKAHASGAVKGADKPEKKKGKRRSEPKQKNRDKNKDRVMSAGPAKKLEDSPFAVLAQLKDGTK